MMRVLGIESSCDETGVAIYDSAKGLLADALYSQVSTHQAYGGVVPELASRDHIRHLVPLLEQALDEASLSRNEIDAIAYTAGPGLIGALLTGSCFAKSLGYALGIPTLAVHHLEAHVLAAKLDCPDLNFPFVALLVSGGHTQLILAHALGQYELLGETVDDAVGEAFDKTAKVMGIAYPGGAQLAALADACPSDAPPLPRFPRPMLDRPGLDFSFSGLKTHALYAWKKSAQDALSRQQIALAFQGAVVDTLSAKCQRALEQTGCRRLVIAGGVGANRALRASLQSLVEKMGGALYFPRPAFCTDNGAMVAYTGYLYLSEGISDNTLAIDVRARWPFA